jgi:hypothetical protein
MGRHTFKDDNDDFDWEEIEKVTKNYKGSADDLEEILIDEFKEINEEDVYPTFWDLLIEAV